MLFSFVYPVDYAVDDHTVPEFSPSLLQLIESIIS